MPKIVVTSPTRLYSVASMANVDGKYVIEPFESDLFNEVFDLDDIDSELDDLVGYLLGSGRYFEITDDAEFDNYGNICLDLGDPGYETYLTVADIRKNIVCDPDKSTYYLLVDQNCSDDNNSDDYHWIVAVPS